MTDKTAHAKERIKRVQYIRDLDKIPQLSSVEKYRLRQVTDKFIFKVNDYYLNLINWKDPDDPIRRLVIPNEQELNEWGRLDACNEEAVTVRKGVQHKYSTTALLLVTESCGCFCRYCFRKRLFMENIDEVSYDMQKGLDYIREHPEINNVLLTGGDPMVLGTPKLKKILKALYEIDNVRIVRIGTKIPAFNPYRFLDDPELFEVLRVYRPRNGSIYFVCHFDHPVELTPQTRQAVKMLQEAGVILVNQNPILRGISDDPSVLAKLWNELSYLGVPQYYIFQGRPTAGNEPFQVPITEAYFKIEEAKKYCSGLAKRVKYVMSHESGKIEVTGVDHNYIYLKYHRAKEHRDEQRFIVCYRDDQAYWLDQLKPLDGYENEFYEDEADHGAA